MKKILLLIILVLFSISTFSQTKQRESYYQKEFAKVMDGVTEVVLEDRTRVDIVTQTHAIEVDFAPKWAENIGQALHYELMTGKKAGVLLVMRGDEEVRFLEILMGVAVPHGIDVWTWNYLDDTWSKIDYKIIYIK